MVSKTTKIFDNVTLKKNIMKTQAFILAFTFFSFNTGFAQTDNTTLDAKAEKFPNAHTRKWHDLSPSVSVMVLAKVRLCNILVKAEDIKKNHPLRSLRVKNMLFKEYNISLDQNRITY